VYQAEPPEIANGPLFSTIKKRIKVVTEKGFISFAAQGGRGAETAERRESDETAQ
jgi:hypothetical protein